MWVNITLGRWWKVIPCLTLDSQSFIPASPLFTVSGISCSKIFFSYKNICNVYIDVCMHPFLGAQECSINAILSFLFLVIGLFYFYIFLKISLYTSYSPPALAATAICTMLHLVQFSCSVTSDSLRSHGLQHTRLPCPSPTPGVCSDSCPLSQRCHPTISFNHFPFDGRRFPIASFDNSANSALRWNYCDVVRTSLSWLQKDLFATLNSTDYLNREPKPHASWFFQLWKGDINASFTALLWEVNEIISCNLMAFQ